MGYLPRYSLSPSTVDERTRRAVGLRPTVLFTPFLVPAHKECFDFSPVFASLEFFVFPARFNVGGRVEISMGLKATDRTAKRLLVRPVGSICIMTDAALLRRVGAPDLSYGNSPFSGIPGELLRDVCQVGGVQVGIHSPCFVLHRCNRKPFVGEL